MVIIHAADFTPSVICFVGLVGHSLNEHLALRVYSWISMAADRSQCFVEMSQF